ncbi:alpha/beta hydrolase [bacterium]|nr:alpha/beta hydrolase [bacterium]
MKFLLPRVSLLVALWGLAGCDLPPEEEPGVASPVVAPEAAAPPEPVAGIDLTPAVYIPTGVAETLGMEYGSGQALDLFVPEGVPQAPLVLMIHGGGWRGGDRSAFAGWCRELALAGYACATMDYRLAPEHPYPAAVEDVAAAVRWLRGVAVEMELDPDRLVVAGSSAGGHLALMAALDEELMLAGGVSLFGPTDLSVLREGPAVAAFLAGADPTGASPISLVSANDPPILLMHGTADLVVPISQSEALRDALEAVGVVVRLSVYAGAGHGFHRQGAYGERALDELLAFLGEVLGDPTIAPFQSPGP